MGHGYRRRPGRDGYADSIARLCRAVAVTLVAATQKAMGQGAVRSQMNLRICFRVRERRDVDLILGQGMLNAGWHAHTLNGPGKFLISSPEHDTPRRARAYLVTDEDVTETTARYASIRPELDDVSRAAIQPASDPGTGWDEGRADANEQHQNEPPGSDTADAAETLWFALCMAPPRSLTVSNCLTNCLTDCLTRVSARKRPNAADEKNAETITRRNIPGGDVP